MTTCAGTKRSDEPRTASAMSSERFCYNHHPDHHEKRRRSASRAATLKHSKMGTEIHNAWETAWDLVYLTVSNELHPNVKKCLIEIVQLLQVYARLTELELAAGEEGPRFDPLPVALPADPGEKVREWVDGEEAKAREK